MIENPSVPSLKKRLGNTVVSAYLFLKKKDQVCLLLRKNTGYCDGMFGLISGHVEDGESATKAMIREAEEEAGLQLASSHLNVIHILQTNKGLLKKTFSGKNAVCGSQQRDIALLRNHRFENSSQHVEINSLLCVDHSQPK
jgi:8-oxo-dGTP pyrophosphatase MutT (NUDIX family)